MNRVKDFILANPLQFIVLLLLSELILGGAGRIIMVGPISFRMIIFIVAMLYQMIIEIKDINKNGQFASIFQLKSTYFVLLFFMTQLIALFLGIKNNNAATTTVLGELLGYSSILLYPIFFRFTLEDINWKSFVYFVEILILIQSSIVILIAAYVLIMGRDSYYGVSEALNKLNYGAFDFIGNTAVPRVFTKGAIFIPMAIIYEFASIVYYENQHKVKTVFFMINIIALIFTFTTSFFAVTGLGILFVAICYRKNKMLYKFVGILMTIGIPIALYLNIFQLFFSRFSGEYTFNMKFYQNEILINEILKRPFFGHGYAKSLFIDYGYEQRYQFHYENAFLQIGLNAGSLGMILFLSMVIFVLYKEVKLLKKYGFKPELILLIFSLSSVFLINFTNPFLNNYIGATILAINIGISEGLDWKIDYISSR